MLSFSIQNGLYLRGIGLLTAQKFRSMLWIYNRLIEKYSRKKHTELFTCRNFMQVLFGYYTGCFDFFVKIMYIYYCASYCVTLLRF